nr:unnamed protein product [Callosobruchus chinensis]
MQSSDKTQPRVLLTHL